MNWADDRADYYYQGINAGGALVSVTGTRREEARRILQNAGGDLRESGFETVAGRASADVEGDRRIQLRGEILRTYKDSVQRAEVRLRKDVVAETKKVEVPVTREELVIERTPVSGQSATGEIGKGEEIRVPLSEERVRTEKQPVVTDEVRVGKRAVQRTENVSDDVRHEELRVDKEGDVDVDTQATGKRKKPRSVGGNEEQKGGASRPLHSLTKVTVPQDWPNLITASTRPAFVSAEARRHRRW